MKKQSAEDYLDKLLNSVNGDEEEISPFDIDEDTNVEMETIEEISSERVSRRVSKSEEDFLKEFEASFIKYSYLNEAAELRRQRIREKRRVHTCKCPPLP